jgi:hypothetical protein
MWKKRILAEKENRKIVKIFFFFGNGHNCPKIAKKVEKSIFGPILLDLQPFFGQILRWPKSLILTYFVDCLIVGHLGRGRLGQQISENFENSQKSIKPSVITQVIEFGPIQTPFVGFRLTEIRVFVTAQKPKKRLFPKNLQIRTPPLP